MLQETLWDRKEKWYPASKASLEFLTILVARVMGSPRRAINRRRPACEGPEPACVQTPFDQGWHSQGEKGELTSCCGAVLSAWQSSSSLTHHHGKKTGLPARVSGRHVVRGRQSSTASRLSVAVRQCARVTGKAGENGQCSGAGRQLTLDKTVGSLHPRLQRASA